ncbi:hypothetical protein DSM110093_03401 (plasmid) [Sulfitobacter sp. DSM 110093]|uniref:hypothetical protein n=1 Tax=Sulfitobacter sp. DSM 110093 TaxID=2883127 RepID=UPI001FAD72FF|nr:hypothetical protein [Sulfitobacter sp. DSM 110093]UOA33572.1 hypothetical protein DSM110093_03401 [Sulfitobacter sp. DSM 110093]
MSDVTVQASKFISARGALHSWQPDGRITVEADGNLHTGKPVPLVIRQIEAESPAASEAYETAVDDKVGLECEPSF